ncbi:MULTISPECIES: winged helix-turn-helix transcriptional regulator [unclassified Streptomyces]|jgi:DNA-binding HxlR family transcriptional regulator|uniref:winged helix-turn-helix transcriptional regulator n=1 Tax=unclassified Streptomyces TaxID=2593676 RepID=UPI00369B36EF
MHSDGTTQEHTEAGSERAFDVFVRACPSRPTLEHVTGKWGGLTLSALSSGTLRFNEVRRRVDGISEKMLSQTLRALERDGLVHRSAQPGNPPWVDYTLTELGEATAARLLDLIDLVQRQMPEVLAARNRYDTTQDAQNHRP